MEDAQLQLARLDAGALRLDREVDLGQLATEVVAPRVPLAAREGVSTPPRASRRAGHGRRRRRADRADPADPRRQRPAPHAARRAVEVGVARDGDEASVAVRDTGEGIPPASQAFVFDRFYRGDVSREAARAWKLPSLQPRRGAPGRHRSGSRQSGRRHLHPCGCPCAPPAAPRPHPRRPTCPARPPGNVRRVTEGEPTALVTGAGRGIGRACALAFRQGLARGRARDVPRLRRTPTPAPASM